jgi:hypothetical protein
MIVAMDDLNPYAAPSIPSDGLPVDLGESCWRDGKYLVATHRVRLPPRSVINNSPAARFESLQLTWYPAWVMLAALLCGPLFFVPLLFCGYRLRIEIPLDEAYFQRRSRLTAICGLMLLLSLVLFVLGCGLLGAPHLRQALFVTAAIVFVFSLLAAALGGQAPLTIYRVNKQVVWLKGASAGFLAALPDWPR